MYKYVYTYIDAYTSTCIYVQICTQHVYFFPADTAPGHALPLLLTLPGQVFGTGVGRTNSALFMCCLVQDKP